MANATLIIDDSKGFVIDIWQYQNEFTQEQWESVIDNFIDIVSDAKDLLERLAEEEKQSEFLDDRLYQLGDVVNFFCSIGIDVRKENEYEVNL